jgi:hypothetical protein
VKHVFFWLVLLFFSLFNFPPKTKMSRTKRAGRAKTALKKEQQQKTKVQVVPAAATAATAATATATATAAAVADVVSVLGTSLFLDTVAKVAVTSALVQAANASGATVKNTLLFIEDNGDLNLKPPFNLCVEGLCNNLQHKLDIN